MSYNHNDNIVVIVQSITPMKSLSHFRVILELYFLEYLQLVVSTLHIFIKVWWLTYKSLNNLPDDFVLITTITTP